MAHPLTFVMSELGKEFGKVARFNFGAMLDGRRPHHSRSDVASGVAAATISGDPELENLTNAILDSVGHLY